MKAAESTFKGVSSDGAICFSGGGGRLWSAFKRHSLVRYLPCFAVQLRVEFTRYGPASDSLRIVLAFSKSEALHSNDDVLRTTLKGSRLYIVSVFGTLFDYTGLYYPRKFHDPTLLMI